MNIALSVGPQEANCQTYTFLSDRGFHVEYQPSVVDRAVSSGIYSAVIGGILFQGSVIGCFVSGAVTNLVQTALFGKDESPGVGYLAERGVSYLLTKEILEIGGGYELSFIPGMTELVFATVFGLGPVVSR